jgi:DNA-binding MarR family transcriptional regulator
LVGENKKLDKSNLLLYYLYVQTKQRGMVIEMSECNHLLGKCLYFSANRFSRIITKLAEEEFKITGLSPTYAFAVTIVNKKENISSKELSEYLHMAPSTITRFVDKLITKGLVARDIRGKNSYVISTKKGKEHQEIINKAWKNLYYAYSEKIGYAEGEDLSNMLNIFSEKLE